MNRSFSPVLYILGMIKNKTYKISLYIDYLSFNVHVVPSNEHDGPGVLTSENENYLFPNELCLCYLNETFISFT